MPVVGNRIKVASSSTGTGNITLGSAENGFQTFAAGGISNNDVVRYVITEGSSWEIGKGTYLTSGPTLVRTSGNLLESSTGALLNLGGSATVFVSLADVDVMQTDGGTFTGDVTLASDVTFTGASYDAVWVKSTNVLRINTNAQFWLGSGGSVSTRFYHDGSNSYENNYTGSIFITNYANDQDIVIATDDGSGGTANYFVAEGSTGEAQLFHYGSEKLATKTGGVEVTGTVTATSFSGDGSNLTGITSIPSGTVMLFAQTAAPTGWTKSTAHDNKALRVVSGTTSSGGSVAFTTAFASQAISGSIGNTTAGGSVGSTTLTTSTIPSHRHTRIQAGGVLEVGENTPFNTAYCRSIHYRGGNDFTASPFMTNYTGSSGSHNHSFSGTAHNHTFSGTAVDLAVQYVDVIIATKN